eukprot:TRINITY_DN15148_c0_g1_i2.p1 TRINITY_DN15148_c0_g1~~TRINITY_DN15148_c0_g1_i2.p1  ORF type:complete len:429 (+),score=140.17 TRINITY_DN15148_c0_g1_i2:182-1288(+)
MPLLPADLAATLPPDWLEAPRARLFDATSSSPLADVARAAGIRRTEVWPPLGLGAEKPPEPTEAEIRATPLSMELLQRAVGCWLDEQHQEAEAAEIIDACSSVLPAADPQPPASPWPRAAFGVVQLRHASTEEHAALWRHGYESVRAAYPSAPVVIIDDGSVPALAQAMAAQTAGDGLCTVVHAPAALTRRGELLLWWVFWSMRPFDTALLIHDSMICQEAVAVPAAVSAGGAAPLWSFNPSDYSCAILDLALLSLLKEGGRDDAMGRYLTPGWQGCFGGAAVASWAAADEMQRRFGVFNLLRAVENRTARMSAERTIGCLLSLLGSEPARFGDVIVDNPRPWGYSWADFEAEGRPRLAPVVKIWAGR